MLRGIKNSQNGFRTFMTNTFLWRKHYDSLGLTPKATQNDIKTAYYKLSMMYHPDKNKDVGAAQRFRDITEAYEVLGNISLKKLYDKGVIGNELSMNMANSGDQNRSHWKAPIQPTEEDPKMKFFRSRNFKEKIPTMDGKTQIYDFDAWNQQYNEEAYKKKSKAKLKRDYNRNVYGDSTDRGIVHMFPFITIIALFIAIVLYSVVVDYGYIGKQKQSKPRNHLESIKDEK